MTNTILVIDDEKSMIKFFEVTLTREGYRVLTGGSVQEGLALIQGEDFDLLLSDIRLGDGQGLDLLAACKEKDPDIPVIMMTAYASPETAVEAMKLGAVDYITKPFNVDEVRVVVRNNLRTRKLINENRELKKQLKKDKTNNLVFQSERMRKLIETLDRVARLDTTILITGESGTGKELIMKYIHQNSSRADKPFVSVNCGALPESLFESELFGYEKGAFTGADKRREGLFESARGGTIFLDEMGEMPLQMQIKLLRVLQEKSIRRVGGTEEIPVDFRLVAATNRNLEKDVAEGNFREDLYYRINVVPVQLPALRERREDIFPLIRFFMEKFCAQCGEETKEIDGEAMASLDTYRWPGNVRELENTIERIVALTPGTIIGVENLPPHIQNSSSKPEESSIHISPGGIDLEGYLDGLRFKYMKKSLEMTDGVQSKSCDLLGMTFRSFRYYLAKGKERGFFD
ncbi:MAG: sigma-54 dependent transcriptional regulator [Acidobacteriota bacterium]|nr:sigma-54 dependent transcriptional regulator [Acidobacteriota bacterium]